MKRKHFMAIVLTICLLVEMLPVMNVQAADTVTLLREYAKGKEYLGSNGITYHGYLYKTYTDADKKFYYFDYALEQIPMLPISYRIDDYDQDGVCELLVVSFDSSYNTILEMYEVEDGEVEQKSSIELNEDNILRVCGIGLEGDCGKFNCFTYFYGGKRVIGVEEYTFTYMGADGTSIRFEMVYYDGEKFNVLDDYSYDGSDYFCPDVVVQEYKDLGVALDIKDAEGIFSGQHMPSEYIVDKVVFAGVNHDTPRDIYELYGGREYEGRIDNVSDITFLMMNTDGVDSESQKDSFNRSVYRASYLIENPSMTSGSVFAIQTPCYIFDMDLKNSGMDYAVAAWKGLEGLFDTADNLSNLGDIAVEQRDIYSAILMNILEASFSESIVNEDLEDGMTLCKEFVSSINDLMEQEWKINLYDENDFKNLTLEQRKSLSEHASDWFAAEHPELRDYGDIFKGVTTAFQTVGSFEDYFCQMVSFMLLNNIGEDMKAILNQAYQDSGKTGNMQLKMALHDCVEIVNASTQELAEKMVMEGVSTAGKNAAKWLFQEVLWNDIMESFYAAHPAAAVLMAVYKGVSFGVNQLLSTDKITEQYLNMLATEDLENLFYTSYRELREKFASAKDTKSAAAYLGAIDLMYQAKGEDCEQAYEFADIVDHTTVSLLAQAFGAKDASETKSIIRDIQKNYALDYESVTSGWIYDLEEDYPGSGLYEYYSDLYQKRREQFLKKQLTAACPVDVYVYGQDGQLAASSVGGVITCLDDQISVVRIGEEKTFLFYDSQDYTVKYVGNDSGTMDISVKEYDANENQVRAVNYYDVELKTGKTYEMPLEQENLVSGAYGLTEEAEGDSTNKVECDYDSMEKSEAYEAAIVNGSMEHNGGIFFEADINAKERVKIHAYVPAGMRFVKWQSSVGDGIFDDASSAETTFIMPKEACTVTAVLEEEPQECAHSYGDVVTRATLQKDGNIVKKCTKCGYVAGKETVPAVKTIKLAKEKFVYNGKNQRPSVLVKDRKGKTLKAGVDYTTIYLMECKNVGIYKMTVALKGNYQGNLSVSYTIRPKGLGISKATPNKKGFTVKWKKQTTQTTGYELQYSTVSKFSKKNTKKVLLKNTTTSKKVTKLKPNKKYYLRIRSYKTVKVNGKNTKIYSGSWSKTKSVKTKK